MKDTWKHNPELLQDVAAKKIYGTAYNPIELPNVSDFVSNASFKPSEYEFKQPVQNTVVSTPEKQTVQTPISFSQAFGNARN